MQMRFIVCARAREDGTVNLVAGESFLNRREAVEAIIASDQIGELLESDVFLVDLDAATPVALIPVGDASASAATADGGRGGDADGASQAMLWDSGATTEDAGSDPEHDADEGAGAQVRLGSVEIDIEAWTCEDCIYVLTCEKSGTLRPAECGLFQWRA
jgi:hypothetical protein